MIMLIMLMIMTMTMIIASQCWRGWWWLWWSRWYTCQTNVSNESYYHNRITASIERVKAVNIAWFCSIFFRIHTKIKNIRSKFLMFGCMTPNIWIYIWDQSLFENLRVYLSLFVKTLFLQFTMHLTEYLNYFKIFNNFFNIQW